MIRRRSFITFLGGAAAWPLAARAQQGGRMRRIGVLMGPFDENDPVAKAGVSAFIQALAGFGWTDGRNCGWTFGGAAVTSIGYERGKRLELLSEIAPGLKRVAFMFSPDNPSALVYVPPLETAVRSLKVEPITATLHSEAEIEPAITALGREPGGGLVLMDSFTLVHRSPIISAAARNNVPAVAFFSAFAREGGLLSYGFDQVDIFRRAATYVDRILRGEKPGDLPVQFPTKFEMVVNRKTAKALGLAIPPSILLRADEVIE
jgi:hypothetical protein